MSSMSRTKELEDEVQTLSARVAEVLMQGDRVKVEIIKEIKKYNDDNFVHDLTPNDFLQFLQGILGQFK